MPSYFTGAKKKLASKLPVKKQYTGSLHAHEADRERHFKRFPKEKETHK
jgi:hypothetical protein